MKLRCDRIDERYRMHLTRAPPPSMINMHVLRPVCIYFVSVCLHLVHGMDTAILRAVSAQQLPSRFPLSYSTSIPFVVLYIVTMATVRQVYVADEQLICWGMHGDGIPCNYDRTESVAMVSLNLHGLNGKNGIARIPPVIMHEYCVSENTCDDINSVLAWDMRHSIAGAIPTCRHDGSAWQESDTARKAKEAVRSH